MQIPIGARTRDLRQQLAKNMADQSPCTVGQGVAKIQIFHFIRSVLVWWTRLKIPFHFVYSIFTSCTIQTSSPSFQILADRIHDIYMLKVPPRLGVDPRISRERGNYANLYATTDRWSRRWIASIYNIDFTGLLSQSRQNGGHKWFVIDPQRGFQCDRYQHWKPGCWSISIDYINPIR